VDDRKDSTFKADPGFLGSTSYSAVFEEDIEHLEVADAPTQGIDALSAQQSIADEKLTRGCKILALLQDNVLVNRFIQRGHELLDYSGEFVICSMMKHWLKELWLHHRETFRSQKPDKIRRLCEQIWRNTQAHLVYDGSISPSAWASLSTGHNLRWEVVGMIMTEIGLAAHFISPLDDIFREFGTTKETLSKRMHEASQTCLAFWRECETQEDLFQWFLNEACSLTGNILGPATYSSYQQTGELVNALIATGFQQEIRPDARTPFFLVEMRKRTRIYCYGQEVSLGSLLGRTSRLSYRYTRLDLPLDLTDAELFLDAEQSAATVAKLDAQGWSSGQKWSRITYMRANMFSAPRREDVLDLSLSNYTREEILQRVAQIRTKYEAPWATLPNFVRAARDTPANRTVPILQALYQNVVRHGYLTTELLLQQVLIRKLGNTADELIKFSKLIFKDIMTLSGRYDISKDYRMEMTWLLGSQGLRSAAILAVELYKQEQLLVYPTDTQLPRAETIRELSIFVERLAEIEPTDGMFAFCDRGRRVISVILDKILAPPRPVVVPPPDGSVNPHLDQVEQQLVNPSIGDIASMDFGGLDASLNVSNDVEFMQWLENMDWDK
jgi:hypothetical protein